jgi:hypothetical protein
VPGSFLLKGRHIDYCLVVDPRPDGDNIGGFAGAAFAEAVTDAFGRRLIYKGLASRTHQGTYDLYAIRRRRTARRAPLR